MDDTAEGNVGTAGSVFGTVDPVGAGTVDPVRAGTVDPVRAVSDSVPEIEPAGTGSQGAPPNSEMTVRNRTLASGNLAGRSVSHIIAETRKRYTDVPTCTTVNCSALYTNMSFIPEPAFYPSSLV